MTDTLICGVNWLGDSVMTMPALQALKAAQPGRRITLLVKSKLASLWSLHGDVDDVLAYEGCVHGMRRAVESIRARHFDRAYVFPNSFRSALLPALAGVPVRIGAPGHWRRRLLTNLVDVSAAAGRTHQLWEYFRILGLPSEGPANPEPRLQVPESVAAAARTRLGSRAGEGSIGLIPGAAYGPAKRWPAESFAEAGRALAKRTGRRIRIFGSGDEADLAARIASDIGAQAVSLAGRTSIAELAVLLGDCRVVVSNDCGGMHLAAAAGAVVVALFGVTDPSKTGPIGSRHRVLCAEGVRQSRDLARDSVEATEALRSIRPTTVVDTVCEILGA